MRLPWRFLPFFFGGLRVDMAAPAVSKNRARNLRAAALGKRIFLRSKGRPFSWAEKSGMLALAVAGPLLFCAPVCAALPLILFVAACLFAPVFPGWGFFYPVISHGRRDLRQISLSFDDGPDPVSTPALLALLRKYSYPATFFVTGRRARRYPGLIAAILHGGHELGNHSYSHEACIMFRSPARLAREMALTQRILARHGVGPVFFRPPVGVNVPAYAEALHIGGLKAVNFSCRARDMGNRRISGLAERILQKVRPGDIVLLHDIAPKVRRDSAASPASTGCADNGAAAALWLGELERIFATLKARQLHVVSLTTLCQCRGMRQHAKEAHD